MLLELAFTPLKVCVELIPAGVTRRGLEGTKTEFREVLGKPNPEVVKKDAEVGAKLVAENDPGNTATELAGAPKKPGDQPPPLWCFQWNARAAEFEVADNATAAIIAEINHFVLMVNPSSLLGEECGKLGPLTSRFVFPTSLSLSG
jgi:hypothetical protein